MVCQVLQFLPGRHTPFATPRDNGQALRHGFRP
jgi:hypothetical protein